MGIAVVTPIQEVLKLLNCDEYVRHRSARTRSSGRNGTVHEQTN
jgi:hypothetical protein